MTATDYWCKVLAGLACAEGCPSWAFQAVQSPGRCIRRISEMCCNPQEVQDFRCWRWRCAAYMQASGMGIRALHWQVQQLVWPSLYVAEPGYLRFSCSALHSFPATADRLPGYSASQTWPQPSSCSSGPAVAGRRQMVPSLMSCSQSMQSVGTQIQDRRIYGCLHLDKRQASQHPGLLRQRRSPVRGLAHSRSSAPLSPTLRRLCAVVCTSEFWCARVRPCRPCDAFLLEHA